MPVNMDQIEVTFIVESMFSRHIHAGRTLVTMTVTSDSILASLMYILATLRMSTESLHHLKNEYIQNGHKIS